MGKKFVVVDHQQRWSEQFEVLRDRVVPAVGSIALSIEHVGSTSVPGLAAKPVIDLDVVVRAEDLGAAIRALESIGYVHRGELGIDQRHAFAGNQDIAHHLYVVIEDCLALRNHLTIRDHLRAHPEDVEAYGALKKRLAVEHADDIDAYVEGKSAFLLGILTNYGLGTDRLAEIEEANRASGGTGPARPES